MRRVVEAVATCARVIAQEIDRLAHFAERVGQRLAGLAARSAPASSRRVRFEQVGGAVENGGALGGRASAPSRPGRAAAAQAASTSGGSASTIQPTISRRSAGLTDRAAAPRGRDRRRRRARARRRARRRRASLLRSRPAEFARSGAEQIARQGDARMRRADRTERASPPRPGPRSAPRRARSGRRCG